MKVTTARKNIISFIKGHELLQDFKCDKHIEGAYFTKINAKTKDILAVSINQIGGSPTLGGAIIAYKTLYDIELLINEILCKHSLRNIEAEIKTIGIRDDFHESRKYLLRPEFRYITEDNIEDLYVAIDIYLREGIFPFYRYYENLDHLVDDIKDCSTLELKNYIGGGVPGLYFNALTLAHWYGLHDKYEEWLEGLRGFADEKKSSDRWRDFGIRQDAALDEFLELLHRPEYSRPPMPGSNIVMPPAEVLVEEATTVLDIPKRMMGLIVEKPSAGIDHGRLLSGIYPDRVMVRIEDSTIEDEIDPSMTTETVAAYNGDGYIWLLMSHPDLMESIVLDYMDDEHMDFLQYGLEPISGLQIINLHQQGEQKIHYVTAMGDVFVDEQQVGIPALDNVELRMYQLMESLLGRELHLMPPEGKCEVYRIE